MPQSPFPIESVGVRRSTVVSVTRRVLVVLAAAMVALAASPLSTAAAKGSTPAAKGRYTTIHVHHTVDIRTLPADRPGQAPQVVPKPSRPARPATTPAGPTRPVQVFPETPAGAPDGAAGVAAPDAPIAAPIAPVRQLTEFTGGGFTPASGTPPDTSAAVGPSDVFEFVNSTFHRYDKTGTQLNTGNESAFFGPPVNAMTTPTYTDARVVYDALDNRFYATILIVDNCKPSTCSGNNNSEVDLAVSSSSSPVGWKVYVVNTTTNNTLLDQPKLGFSSDKVVITENENGFGGPFQYIVVQKSDLLAQAPNAATFFFSTDDDHFNVIPAISLSPVNTDFAMSANGGSSTLTVFRFTGTPLANNVSMSTTDFSIGTINDPPLADQPNDTRQLDTGPSGVQSVVFENGTIIGAGNDSCTPVNDTVTRPCLRFDNVSAIGGLNLVQDGDLGRTGADLFYPAVTMDTAGNLWVGHSTSSPTQFASATQTIAAGGIFPTTVPAIDYAVGVGPYDCTFCTKANGDARNRFGDYSAAAQDPADPSDIWLAEEWGSTSTASTDAWGTAIARFTAAPTTTTTIASSANPSVFGQSVAFTTTVSSAAAGTPQGHVTLSADSSPLATVQLVNAQATVSTSALAPGTHTISAVYTGDATFDESSGTLAQTVGQASTTTTLTATVNASILGEPVTFTATVAPTPPGGGTPSGLVVFRADGSQLGGPVPLFDGFASSNQISSLGPGSHTISAQYNGDADFLPSSTSMIQVVSCDVTLTGQVSGPVTVTQSTCASAGTTINGNVIVQPGGALGLSGAQVKGSISANGASYVQLCGDTVSGPVTISGSAGRVLLGDGGDDGTAACAGNLVKGNITLMDNHAGVEVGSSTVLGNLVFNGTSGGGPVLEDIAPEIEANHVQGALSCTGNSPAPTNDGQPNTVAGARSGQCASTGF